MCGILGFCGQPREGQWGQTHALLTSLFVESECRGSDAAGFAAMMESYKGKSHEFVTSKAPVPARTFIRNAAWRGLRHHRCCSLIAHTRLATTGPAQVNANNHPHVSPSQVLQPLALVHNGHVRNWEKLTDEHRWRLRSGCDSEVILRLIEDANHPAEGLAQALQACEGSIATVLLDMKRQGVLWLGRNDGSPFWLLRLMNDKRIFFASTRSILLEAFSQVLGEGWKTQIDFLLPLADGYIHALSPTGGYIGLGY